MFDIDILNINVEVQRLGILTDKVIISLTGVMIHNLYSYGDTYCISAMCVCKSCSLKSCCGNL